MDSSPKLCACLNEVWIGGYSTYILIHADHGEKLGEYTANASRIPEVNRVKERVLFNVFQRNSYLLGK